MTAAVTGDRQRALAALLRWLVDAGADETIGNAPICRFRPLAAAAAPSATPTAAEPSSTPTVPDIAPQGAAALAARCTSIAELVDALSRFEGCTLRTPATRLVFGDGNPEAEVVLIGEAPGAEEDRLGKPFVGPSGQLLDRMLASIGLDRDQVFISNTVFWRPPANRAPTAAETAACQPFVERLLEIIAPRLIIALGGPAAAVILGQAEAIGRLRGRWFTWQTPRMARPAAATALYHPAYLLRSPGQKRLAWRDLLAIKRRLNTAGTP